MKRTRKIAAILLAMIWILVTSPVPAAQAAFWTIEASWYKNQYTCESRGQALFEMNQILTWYCTQNGYYSEYPYRYTLHINKRQPGDPMPYSITPGSS